MLSVEASLLSNASLFAVVCNDKLIGFTRKTESRIRAKYPNMGQFSCVGRWKMYCRQQQHGCHRTRTESAGGPSSSILRNSGHCENIRVCMGIFTIGLRR